MEIHQYYHFDLTSLGALNRVIQPDTKWKDPMPDMLHSINELTFRTAVQVATRERTRIRHLRRMWCIMALK